MISIAPNYVALKTEQSWHFIQAASLVKKFLKKLLEESVTSSQTGLLFPIEHTLEASILESCECHQLMQRLGFEWRPAGENALKFFKVPAWLLPLGNEVILESLTKWLTFFQQVSFSSKDLINFIEQQVENGELIFDASMLQPMLECIDAHKDLNEEMLKIDKSLLEQLFAQLKPN